MKKLMTICLVVTAVLAIGAVANADWDNGDPYKMHYPQLPNMSGQDIEPLLADDWMCTESGAVKDVHFWTFNDQFPSTVPIYMAIFSNNPNYNELGYSAPEYLLWGRYFQPEEYTVRAWENFYWQFNITDIEDPFIQTEGTVYWLGLRIQLWEEPHLYWNYTDNGYLDKAVYWNMENTGGQSWFPLGGDLAFVITPEPATIAILGIGALSLLRRKK